MGKYYTICVNLYGYKCLVVGGGKVAERKVQTLLDCGADITVISPDLTPGLLKLKEAGAIIYKSRKYDSEDLNDIFLAISATNDEEVNKQIADECFAKKILVNVVDDPPKCNFIVPAVMRRGSLSISISTDGKSPLLARKIREKLENDIGPEYEKLIEIMGSVRKKALLAIPDEIERRKIFYNLIDSDLIELIRKGQDSKVKERIESVFGDSWLKP